MATIDKQPLDKDAQLLEKLGYQQELKRTFGHFENFATTFCSINVIGCVRAFFYLGLAAGGPLAMWTSALISIIFVSTTALTLAEICSSIPVSGSTYIWASEAAYAGDPQPSNTLEESKEFRFSQFIGFIVAWWAAAGWMTFPAVYAQQTAAFFLSLYPLFGENFPGGVSNDNVKWRAVTWIIAEIALLLAVIPNYMNPIWYRRLLRFSMFIMMLDFLLCAIWLPIAVSNSYGFRTAKEALLTTNNGMGAPEGWNWLLSFVFAISAVTGYDASGHVSEETKHAKTIAPRGVFWSGIVCSTYGFALVILFLFCTPDIGTLLSLNAPQPFVLIYGLALGRGGAVFMTTLAGIGLICSTSVTIIAASRLVYAIARDGPLPLGKWVSRVNECHPYNAVTVVSGFCAVLLCTILASSVAFTSLISAGTLLIITPYGLIALLRLTITPNKFKNSTFSLGKYRHIIYAAAFIFDLFLFAILVSPFYFPVTGATFNFACVIFGVVTLCGVLSWWYFPPWLVAHMECAQPADSNRLSL